MTSPGGFRMGPMAHPVLGAPCGAVRTYLLETHADVGRTGLIHTHRRAEGNTKHRCGSHGPFRVNGRPRVYSVPEALGTTRRPTYLGGRTQRLRSSRAGERNGLRLGGRTPCSSVSRIAPGASWFSPKKKRGCSTTTTSEPSTSCSG